MTDATPTLTLIRDRLESAGVAYMIVGSTVVGWLGHSRATVDVDVVIDPTPIQLDKLVVGLKSANFYLDEVAAADALERRSMVNAIDPETGWKIDLIVLADADYERTAFARRKLIETSAGKFPCLTPEDLILSKMIWRRDSQSEKQWRDIKGVFDIWRSKLDMAYIKNWAVQLELSDQLNALLDRPE